MMSRIQKPINLAIIKIYAYEIFAVFKMFTIIGFYDKKK